MDVDQVICGRICKNNLIGQPNELINLTGMKLEHFKK